MRVSAALVLGSFLLLCILVIVVSALILKASHIENWFRVDNHMNTPIIEINDEQAEQQPKLNMDNVKVVIHPNAYIAIAIKRNDVV